MAKEITNLGDLLNNRFNLFIDRILSIRINLADSIILHAQEMVANGVSIDNVVNEIYNSIIDSESSLSNKESKELWNMLKGISQDIVYKSGELNLDTLYKWELNANGVHCQGCLDRSSWEAMTLEEWEPKGLPGSGVTECTYKCLCSIVPINKG
jgi:hypothetical protein